MASKEYYHGVRLVKTHLANMINVGAMVEKPIDRTFLFNFKPSYQKFVVVQGKIVHLYMLYGNTEYNFLNLWELFYTPPCAGLTFVAEKDERIISAVPELIKEFTLTQE